MLTDGRYPDTSPKTRVLKDTSTKNTIFYECKSLSTQALTGMSSKLHESYWTQALTDTSPENA